MGELSRQSHPEDERIERPMRVIGAAIVAAQWEARLALITSITALIASGVAILHG